MAESMRNSAAEEVCSLRRTVLKGCVGALACIAVGGSPRAAGSSAGRIDVHHHFIPPAFREFFASAKQSPNGSMVLPPMDWNLTADLEDMDRGGTRTSILSIFTPYDVGSSDARRSLAREINEAAARMRTDHAGRYGSFATLPLPDMEASLRELEYSFDTLHADGVALYSNVGDRWLGHTDFTPLHEELNRRAAVVFVHPTAALCCRNLVAAVPDPVVEFGTDTTRAIASLIFSGTTARFPNIRFIFAHGGGTMPFLIERFLGGTSDQIVPGIVTRGQPPPYVPHQPEGGALKEIRRMFFDTAQCSNPVAMGALRKVVPVSQILFGTDYFYRTAEETARSLAASRIFNPQELRAIERRNAEQMFPRLRIA